MTFLTEGVQEFKVASEYSYVPDNGRVPTLAEHYTTQQLDDLPAPPSSDYADKPEIPQFEDALGTTKDVGPNESILVLQGRLDVQDMQVPTYRTGITGRDVFRLALSEVSIGVFHMSSFGWRSGYHEGCENWVKFLTAAIAAQTDYITGDGNVFAQRNFKQAAHTDFKSCDTNINADCMIMISLSYGKQSQVSLTRSASQTATADGVVVGSAFSDEVLLTDSERPKYLQNIDLGLKDSDEAAHSPLVVVSKLHGQRNLRTRSDQSDQRRKDKRYGRPERPRGRAQYDDDEEEEEENDPVGRLRNTTPSLGACLRGQDTGARGSQTFENTARVPVAPPKMPPIPPPSARRRERSQTPVGRNTQRRANTPQQRPQSPRQPPQRSWHQQQQYEYQRCNQPYTRHTPRATAPVPPAPPPPPAPAQAAPAYWQRGGSIEYDPKYKPFQGPRWVRNNDSSWCDRCPEFPWQSIYYNQPSWQRRNNELWLYGYTFRMGL
eukprot:s894_g11.t1